MTSYLIGAVVLLLFTTLFYAFGAAIRKDPNSFPINLIVGYIAHSFFIAILVVPIQLMRLSYCAAVVAVVAVFLTVASFTLLRWKKYRLRALAPTAGEFIRRNYFLVLIALALFAIYLLQTDLIWNNNNTDDGFYLLKTANLPYMADPFSIIYGSGFVDTTTTINSYLASSVQTEMAVYVDLFHVDPVIFMRGFLNFFHYFLAAASVAWFGKAIADSTDVRFSADKYQYFAGILLLLSFEFRTIENWNILAAQDLWQFNAAMWYGGTLARVVGIIWVITPFLSLKRIDWKTILSVGVVSVALISKAAAALPIIFVAVIGYLLAFGLTSGLLGQIFAFLLVAVSFGLGVILPGVPETNALVNNVFLSNATSPFLWGSVLLIVAGMIAFRSRAVARVGIILGTALALLAIPELNDIFEQAAIVDFVALRAQTAVLYTLLITGFVFLSIFIAKYFYRRFEILQVMMAGVLALGSVASTVPVYGNPLTTYTTMAQNYRLIPEATAELSEHLEDIATDYPLDVLAPEWVELGGRRHFVASVLRVYAPSVRSISTITRFGSSQSPDYDQWWLAAQGTYDNFMREPSLQTFEIFKPVLVGYPIDVLVMPNDGFEPYAQETGFELVDRIDDFYVYLKQ